MLNSIDNIKKLVGDEFEAMNQLISNQLNKESSLIHELCLYLIDSGGKRLRPLVVFLASKACGYFGNAQIQLASAIEYFHSATLLHDDVVDESTLRRGKETANEVWGNKASVLVGDYLFSQAFQWISGVENFDVLHVFSKTALGISRGEVKQLNFKHNANMKMSDYFDIIRSKTALLFSTSAEIGSILAQSSTAVQECLRDYGLHLGNAFQMVDDALDYVSYPEIMGKNRGDDLADGKLTLPLFCALERSNKEQAAIIIDSINKGSLEKFSEVLKILEETKALDYTYQLANQEVNKAIESLNILEESPYKQGLLQIARFAVSRQH